MEKDKVLIIGGSGGIGKDIVEILLNEGMFVINVDKKTLNICMENYHEIIVDLSSDNADSIVRQIIYSYKKIYAFICAIGYYGVNTLSNYSRDSYYHTMATNVEIPTFFSVEISKLMQRYNRGKMIFISSAAAYIGSRDIPYSISKAAILGLVRGLGKNLKETNVYIYGIAPGVVESPMSEQMSVNRKAEAVNGTLNKRVCNPLEIAKVIRFLILEDDGYMNGSVIHINDGLYLN